jgi:hypothetical protein
MDQAPFVLMELAEQNLRAMRDAISDLAAERGLLERERRKFEFEVKILRDENSKVVADAVTAAVTGTKETIAAAVAETKVIMTGAASQLLESLKTGAAPILEKLGNVTKQAATADNTLRNVIKWATWRYLGATVTFLAFLLVAGWLASTGILWFDTKTIANAQVAKVQLQQEIADLKATQAAWVQGGYSAKLSHCGPDNRPCVEVNENAGSFGTGDQQDYRILSGY